MSLTHEAWSKIMQAQGGHFTAEQDRQILADYQRLEARAEARPAPADALREAVRYALDVFSQYDGKHIMQALQFTDHIKKMAAALAERPEVHEEPKNIEWVCAQIADCVWGCSWPPLDLTEEEISRIREGAQYLMTSLRPATAANTGGLRAVLEKARVLIVNMDKWNTDVEKIIGKVPNTGFERAGDLIAEIDAALRQSAKEGA